MVPSHIRPARVRFIAFASFLLCAACDEDTPVTPPPPPAQPAWSEIASLPPSFTAYALWAASPDYVVAVGPGGLVRRWGGQRWDAIPAESGKDLYAIAGDPVGPIVIVGDDGVALRLLSSRFVVVPTPTTEDLRGAWMAARDDFFAVGAAGTVLRGDGAAWALQSSGTTTALYAVWGSAADDVFAVGMDGVILHYDGGAWSEMQSGTSALLASVHGTASDDVYAVGEQGTILHYDGAAWTNMTAGTSALLQSVCAAGTPMAVGAGGTILSLGDGGSWAPHEGVSGKWLYGITRAGERTWIVGVNEILSHDGTAWQKPVRGAVPVLRTVEAERNSRALVAGGDDGYLARGTGDEWNVEDVGAVRTIRRVWQSEDGDVFAVGTNRILRREGRAWVVESSEIAEFHDIDGLGALIFAVGSGGRIRVRTSSGWGPYPTITPLSLHGVEVLSGPETYVVGEDGWIALYNGIAWRSMRSRTTADLFDVIATPGNDRRAIAVGDAGVIRELPTPSGDWFAMTSPTPASLHALAFGPGDHLYAAGGGGTLLRLDGDVWQVVPTPTGRTLLGACSRKSVLFLAGGDDVGGAVLLRYGAPPR